MIPASLPEARDAVEREALIEAGRKLFARPCSFFYAAQKIDQLPPPRGPEIALCGRSNVGKSSLVNVLLLLDARIETKASDRAAMELLAEAAVAFQIVLTKADDAKPYWLAKRTEEAQRLARAHTAGHPMVLVTSAETGLGIPELRAEIATLAAPE